MVIEKCPRCHEWYEVKYGKKFQDVVKNLDPIFNKIFCSEKCRQAHIKQWKKNHS